ncbi:MAG: LytTR family DNA-binding domain-containing protein [Algoriphagus sp.]|uniref:LytR/AlgR family response regulator transcription factor n=1 Tax=Algoriphagus sp. TaxID=1872435 RepID=UPI0026122173|nr:LytTR family DNA-binding domain-containing protein [Algoriphagus sp.]MDG1276210.1 LytTR family DNA-binding domain-containing protein [Algoriphagus sp.]
MIIVIIEDERPAANRLIRLLEQHFVGEEFVQGLDSVKKSIQWFSDNPAPDLIFCDIQLADGISFEIFEQVKLSTPIIFTTAYDQYAIKAFQVNAIDYLLKPVDPEELARSISKYKANQLKPSLDFEAIKAMLAPKVANFKTRFLVKYGEKIQSITVEEIAFFYSEARVTFLQTTSGKQFVLDQTLEQVESQVDPDSFFRLNRKYLCSFPSISEIFTYSNSRLKVKLVNCSDEDILISREKTADFKTWLDG